VGLVGRSIDRLEDAARAIQEEGGEAAPIVADVLDADALGRAVERLRERFGPIDALVVAAGTFRGVGPIGRVDPDAWWRDVETALRGAFLTVRAALPDLTRSGKGSICVMTGGAGLNGELANGSGHGAAQAGLARLVETLAVELRPIGVPVYAVNPGFVPTPLVMRLVDDPEARRWLPRFTEAMAEGKEVGPEVAAEMVAWLADERPMALSGRVIPAVQTPEILLTRLGRIAAEDLHRLRLK
jgi:NAD(P)-dependent dehydrogenase (short-subunit alcohol dehydrogenase family)